MSKSTTPRPYTSYNLFFQLEREYILQSLLDHRPEIAPDDVFHPAAETYPAGAPPLPSRFAGLILPYDWYIPGKARRRKRNHRKSHGKIGFHELNEQISQAWSRAEDEVREFCTRLAEIQSTKHKKDERKSKRSEREKAATKKMKSEAEGEEVPLLDWAMKFSNSNQEDSAAMDLSSNDMSTKSVRKVSFDSFDVPLGGVVSGDSIHVEQDDVSRDFSSRSVSFEEVDMADDEIIDIWKKTSTDNDGALCQFCVEITNDTANDKQDDTARKSFIEAEYEKFKELGQLFLKQKQPGMPARLRRNSIAACQA